jgi:hypothetical protein
MRLALHATTEVGLRVGRILLAERSLEALGFYGPRRPGTEDRRSTAIADLAGFQVLVSDDTTAPADLARIALEDGLSCVLAADTDPDPDLVAGFATAGRSLLTGASLPGLAPALATHQAAGSEGAEETLLAWTVQGKPARRGVAVPFPDPVGARWGSRLPRTRDQAQGIFKVECPIEGPWAAALARLSRGRGSQRVERLVAVADDRFHLEALALAAGALVVAEGAAPRGGCRPGDTTPAYLRAALRLGLEVAGLDL